MTDSELDAVYTRLCKTITQFGENNAPLFLAPLPCWPLTASPMERWRSNSLTPPPRILPLRPATNPWRIEP